MKISSFHLTPLEIPFNHTVAHASASRSVTESVLVTVHSAEGLVGVGEGCPRRYVTGESVESVRAFVEAHWHTWEQCSTLNDLQRWAASHEALIDRNPAAWCAVETACLDLLGREAGCPIESLLCLPSLAGAFRYSAVLGTDNPGTFQKQLSHYLALGFTDFKVKVTGNFAVDRHKIDRLKEAPGAGLRIRLDANNLWTTPREASDYVSQLGYPFSAIEEPLQVGDNEGCRTLSRELGLPIILDESVLRVGQFRSIQDTPSCWIVNLRVSKMGGLLRSLAVAERAKEVGIPIIIGAQVGETSILTRVALTVASAYRDRLAAQEGAFGTYLLEREICRPVLMFGKGGWLAPDSFRSEPGLGLTVATSSMTDRGP